MDNISVSKCNINNRRYLGNKYTLNGFIREVVDGHCKDINSVLDIFSGTGSVAYAFIDKVVFTNDMLYSNYICNYAWFSSEPFDEEKIMKLINEYNNLYVKEENYMTTNFSNTFFSTDDCSKIGFIRESIEKKYNLKEINSREKAILITSLIYGMDRIANTVGHYDAYIKTTTDFKKLVLPYPNVPKYNNTLNKCFNLNANDLAPLIEADLVYLDPPYNSRQYCDAYHLLENVARWDKPEVYGVAKKMDRSSLKSEYCGKNAPFALDDLIEKIRSKYILLSYNSTGNKRNARSNARISDDEIQKILEKKGKVMVFSKNYKTFSTGKTKTSKNEERLFLCICGVKDND